MIGWIVRAIRDLFTPRPDGITEEFASEHHGCDPLHCCLICNRHTLPHRRCVLR
jgi:hypothetical protein